MLTRYGFRLQKKKTPHTALTAAEYILVNNLVYICGTITYLLRKLLSRLLLHNFRYGSRWLLRFSLFELIDLVTIVGMIRIIWIQEIKFRIVDFILADSGFKLRAISVKEKKKKQHVRQFSKIQASAY